MLAVVDICIRRDIAGSIEQALAAELRQPAPEKGRVAVEARGGCLRLVVESGSLSGLRALVNSFLLLVHAAYSSILAAGSASGLNTGERRPGGSVGGSHGREGSAGGSGG